MTNLPQFVRQDAAPLYPKILYNRPITRDGAGRLLVPGGHTGELSLPTGLHQLCLAAGLGHCQVILPDSLASLVAGAPDTAFVPASPSGSLGREALGRILQLAEEADGVALGASLSNNSDTAMLVERLLMELEQPVIVFADGLVAMQHHIRHVTDRPDCLVIATMPEVFKLAGQLGVPIQIRRDGGLINKLEIIQNLADASKCQYVIYGSEIIVAAGNELVVTPVNYRLSLLPAAYYAVLATMWLQNRNDRRAGLVTGAYVLNQASQAMGAEDQASTTKLAAAITRALQADVV